MIAGNGNLPLVIAAEARRQGLSIVAVAHHSETSPTIEELVDWVTWVHVGELGKIIRTFQKAGVEEVVMVGGIRKARLFSGFRPDLRGVAFLARMKSRGDDQLLRGVARELEGEGIRVLKSTFLLSRMLPSEGVLTQRAPTSKEWEDIHLGIRVLRAVGELGVGQSVIVKGGVVLAVEAIEGTDAAIVRGGELGKGGIVLVKTCKPGQDFRFDLPTVGLETVKLMGKVEGMVVAVQAGKTILLDREELVLEADRAGIAVVAVDC